MKLGNILVPNFDIIDEDNNNLDAAGIIEAKRFIYLFFNQNDLDDDKEGKTINGNVILGKAIQVNMSVSRGGDNIDVSPWMRGSRNSTYMNISIYTYDTRFETSIRNVRGAEFTLINSVNASTLNDYDIKRPILLGSSLYTKDIRDDQNKKDILDNTFTTEAPTMLDPIYYTARHQEVESDEIYSISQIETVISHMGYELIDNNTTVSLMNIALMDSMDAKLRDKLYEIRTYSKTNMYGSKMFDTTEFSDMLLFQNLESMQTGFIYTYDTDLGKNIQRTTKSYIPFREYQFENKMVQDLQRTIETIEQRCKSIENEFGHVRVMFTPAYIGDKVDIYFKDYSPETQPTIRQKTSIDNGMKVQDEISSRLNDADEGNEFDFDDEGDFD